MNTATGTDFALIGHPASFAHFVRLMEATAEAGAGPRLNRHRSAFEQLIDWMPPYVSRHSIAFSAEGRTIRGRLIICPFLPKSLRTPAAIKRAFDKVVKACGMAEALGVRTIALGGFTSIVMRDGSAALTKATVTTGASLTAALAVEQLEAALGARDRSIRSEEITVFGATGDVGAVATRLLAARGAALCLVARNLSQLERLRESLAVPQVRIMLADRGALSCSRAVILATSAAQPLFGIEEFASGTVLCDVGYPKTHVAEAADKQSDGRAVFAGGLARFPTSLGLTDYTELGADDLLFGCFSEGMLLAALPAATQPRAIAASPERANELMTFAQQIGITPGPVG